MVLKNDRNAGRERGQRERIARKSQAVYVEHIRRKVGEQCGQTLGGASLRFRLGQGQKITGHPAPDETLRVRARLHDGDANAPGAGGFSDIHKLGQAFRSSVGDRSSGSLKKLIWTTCNRDRMASTDS